MGTLPTLKAREVVAMLERLGFAETRRTGHARATCEARPRLEKLERDPDSRSDWSQTRRRIENER